MVVGSPAIDASPADAECPPVDQRGISRPQGAACDIGSFEVEPGGPEICGNCSDDDGDGKIDLADDECSAQTVGAVKGSLSLNPTPDEDQMTLTVPFAVGPAFDPLVEGASVSFFDTAGTIACVRFLQVQRVRNPRDGK